MDRAYISIAAGDVKSSSDGELFGQLATKLPFALEPTQKAAWEYQIHHLRQLAFVLPGAHFYMEFLIPRMGRRADLIVLHAGIIFVVEYKLGAQRFDRSSLEQVYGYGLDLKHFHETSHDLPVVPILVATEASTFEVQTIQWDSDKLARPLHSVPSNLAQTILDVERSFQC